MDVAQASGFKPPRLATLAGGVEVNLVHTDLVTDRLVGGQADLTADQLALVEPHFASFSRDITDQPEFRVFCKDLYAVHAARPRELNVLQFMRHYQNMCQAHEEHDPRASGRPYRIHPAMVFHIMVNLFRCYDPDGLIAGLYHDVLEDHPKLRERLQGWVNPRTFRLIEAETKLAKKYGLPEARRKENALRFFEALAEDLITLIIKGADFAHNMDTLHFFGEERRAKIERKADEYLLDFYPLLMRAGCFLPMRLIADLAYYHRNPARYQSEFEPFQVYRRDIKDRMRVVMAEIKERAQLFDIRLEWAGLYEYQQKRKQVDEKVRTYANPFNLICAVAEDAEIMAAFGRLACLPGVELEHGTTLHFNFRRHRNGFCGLTTRVRLPQIGLVVPVQFRSPWADAQAQLGPAAYSDPKWKKGQVERSQIPDEQFASIKHLFKDPGTEILEYTLDITERKINECAVSDAVKEILRKALRELPDRIEWFGHLLEGKGIPNSLHMILLQLFPVV